MVKMKLTSGYREFGTFCDNSEWRSGETNLFANELLEVEITSTIVPANAFAECINLEKVTLSKNVAILESEAFAFCSKLKEINLENVRIIEDRVFCEDENLEIKDLPESLISVGEGCFMGCKKVNISSTKNLISVGELAFSNTGIERLTIEKMKYIPDLCFTECRELKEVNFPNDLLTIGEEAFSWSAIEVLNIPESVEAIKPKAFVSCKKLRKSNFPRLKEMCMYLFAGSGLEEFTIPDSVEDLDWGVFADCKNLKSLEIPETVLTVGPMNFEGWTKHQEVKLHWNTAKNWYRLAKQWGNNTYTKVD